MEINLLGTMTPSGKCIGTMPLAIVVFILLRHQHLLGKEMQDDVVMKIGIKLSQVIL